MIKIHFWGVRGSVPAPLTGEKVNEKIHNLLIEWDKSLDTDISKFLKNRPFWERSTYGGNTPCIELMVENQRIVLDMGTGLRVLGNSLFPEMMKNNGLNITFLLSHVHWDHIQGLPFFGPLYVNKESNVNNSWTFYGGTDWMKTAEVCLCGQMDSPQFPISWEEIKKMTHALKTHDIYDRKSFVLNDDIRVKTRKLNHPQETYGWRIEHGGKVIAYTTDNEPYDPLFPDPKLLDLTKNADIWITDCQYTKGEYEGANGVSRHGWGHSYPLAVAKTAAIAKIKKIVLFHHDPSHTDKQIKEMEEMVIYLLRTLNYEATVQAAYEGMEIEL